MTIDTPAPDGGANGMSAVERRAQFMAEAEVTLGLAFWLLDGTEDAEHADIAIDGAHVRIKAYEQNGRRVQEQNIFDIKKHLAEGDCQAMRLTDDWRGTYQRRGKTLAIKSRSGFDVQMRCAQRIVAAECKGGPLETMKGRGVSTVFPLAIGQAVTCSADIQPDRLLIGVPDSPAFERVGRKILRVGLFQKTGI